MGSSLCNEFVSEVYTVPNVSGPMSGFTVSPKGPRELFFAINVNIKVLEVLLKLLEWAYPKMGDFGYDFFGLILVVLAVFMMSRVQF